MVLNFNHTHAFTPGQKIYYRVRAKNNIGWGVLSTELEVTCDDYPTFMNAPTIATADIHPEWIKVTWAALSTEEHKGRDEIVSYGIEWDQGTGVWANLSATDLGVVYEFNHTSSSGPFPNNTAVKYRAYAKNSIGYGAYSTQTSIITDNTPTRMNAPSSTQVDYNKIYLTWSAITSDADTGGDPVTYYYVDFFNRPCYATDAGDCSTELESLGSWTEVSSYTT